MKKLLKLVLLVLVIAGFFLVTGYVYYDLIYLHLIILGVIIVLHILRFDLASTGQMILVLLPFTVTIFIFGVIFQIINLMGRSDWLHDSLIKVLYFPASFLFTKLIISLFTYEDVLDLPLRSGLKSDIIFVQVFVKKAFRIMPRLEFHIRIHPLIQGKKGILRTFLIFCTFPLSLYIYLIDEGTILRQIYLSRLKHLEEK
jgi:hypothetical protein